MLLMGCSLKLGGWFLGSPIHYFCTAVDRGKLWDLVRPWLKEDDHSSNTGSMAFDSIGFHRLYPRS